VVGLEPNGRDGIHGGEGADAAVTGKDALAQIRPGEVPIEEYRSIPECNTKASMATDSLERDPIR
jgi:hypothetical protein